MNLFIILLCALLPFARASRDYGNGKGEEHQQPKAPAPASPPAPPTPPTTAPAALPSCNMAAAQSCQNRHQNILERLYASQENENNRKLTQAHLSGKLVEAHQLLRQEEANQTFLRNEIQLYSAAADKPNTPKIYSQDKSLALQEWLKSPNEWQTLANAWLHIAKEALDWNFVHPEIYFIALVREQMDLQNKVDTLQGGIYTLTEQLSRVTVSEEEEQSTAVFLQRRIASEQQYIESMCKKDICGQ